MTVILTYGNLKIKALNEDDQNTEESIKPSAEQIREARAAVREALHEQRVNARNCGKE